MRDFFQKRKGIDGYRLLQEIEASLGQRIQTLMLNSF